MDLTILGFIIFFVFVAFLVITTLVVTPGKTARIIERFGRPQEHARLPGLSFKLPWPIDICVGEIYLQLEEATADVSCKTADNAFMTLPVKVQYRADSDPAGAVRAYYELEDSERQIISYVLNNVKSTVSTMDMDDLYRNRDSIESQVQEALQERFSKYGYKIENVLIDEPQPSDEVKEAFNRVIASKREKEAAQNVADAKRIELVGVAQAEKESKKLQGEGMAEMREAIAKGMHQAMETLTSTGLSVQEALMLLMDTNRLDTLGSAATHGNMILVDMEKGRNELPTTIAAIRAENGRSSESEK